MEKLFKLIRKHQAAVLELLFLVAGLAGVAIQALHPGDPGEEMMSLARNVAGQNTFANPFSIFPTGPTATEPPLYPLVLAGLIKLLHFPVLVYGAAVVGTILANATTALLLPVLSIVFYGDMIPGVIASVLWMTTMQSIPGWDTSYTIAGLLLFCCVSSSTIVSNKKENGRAVLIGTTAGLLFLLNPASVVIALLWLGFLFWRIRADPCSTRHLLIALAVLCAFVIVWGERNSRQLGAFVVRTNLGMTLFASNNDCAESSLFRSEMNGCYQEHHPNANIREAELLRSVGEVYYDQERIADTKAWIQSDPSKFLKLTMARIREFWFPAREVVPPGAKYFADGKIIPDYIWSWVRQQNRIAYAIWLVTGLSIPGLILMAYRREAVTIFAFAVLALYPLIYYVVVSDMRYRYPILFLSLLPAGYFIRRVAAR